MRWRKKDKKYPKDGDVRIVTKFLLFPMCIGDEYRWMEIVRIEQRYRGYNFELNIGGYWCNVGFVTGK